MNAGNQGAFSSFHPRALFPLQLPRRNRRQDGHRSSYGRASPRP
jgi:hypothetical protein